MKTQEALKLVGGLSKPSKMPGWAYGIPAAECKTGKKLRTWKAAPVMVVTLSKAATFLKLCRKHSTGAWRLSSTLTGSEQWFTCYNLRNQNFLDGTTQGTYRT